MLFFSIIMILLFGWSSSFSDTKLIIDGDTDSSNDFIHVPLQVRRIQI